MASSSAGASELRGGAASQQVAGVITKTSPRSVADTVQRLTSMLESKGVRVFDVIDHSGEAAKVGMKMPPTKLLIFGNPKAGTPLMLAAPSSAIDLPLKILAFEQNGQTWVAYNDPKYLQRRHGFPQELVSNLAPVAGLAQAAAAD